MPRPSDWQVTSVPHVRNRIDAPRPGRLRSALVMTSLPTVMIPRPFARSARRAGTSLRRLILATTLLCLPAAARAENDPPQKAPLVPDAAPLAETGRYESKRTFDEVLEFYKRTFKSTSGLRWHSVINQPGIKAKHIASLRKKTDWEGINIYEVGGRTRIYVIPREAPARTASKSKPATPAGKAKATTH